MARSRVQKELERTEAVDELRHLREQVERALYPFKDRIEAATAAAACLIVAKTLLEKYKPARREELLRGAVAFLRGEQLEDRTPAGIVIPKGFLM